MTQWREKPEKPETFVCPRCRKEVPTWEQMTEDLGGGVYKIVCLICCIQVKQEKAVRDRAAGGSKHA